ISYAFGRRGRDRLEPIPPRGAGLQVEAERDAERARISEHRAVMSRAVAARRGEQLLEVLLVEQAPRPTLHRPPLLRAEAEPQMDERKAVDGQVLRRRRSRSE